MPSLRIIYDVDGWGFHHRARALLKHAPPDFTVSLAALSHPEGAAAALGTTPVDLVFVLPECTVVHDVLRPRGWISKLIGGWNCGWPHMLPVFYEILRASDAMIINNRMTWERTGRLPRTYVNPNGVDLDTFSARVPIEGRRARVLWVGSEAHRQRKGHDRFILPLAARLRAKGIECEVRLVDSFGAGKWTPEQMAEWYNTGTVLVCASETEGGPNPALEAAACGCVVVSTAVGSMPELIRDDVNGYLVERDLDALLAGTTAACDSYVRLATQMQQDIAPWGWKARSAEFFQVFREVLAGGPARRPAPRNLADAVTVFVITTGAPSLEVCRRHLDMQDCAFRLEIVEQVAPRSAALQRMLDRCVTPYFLQVDEDMLLYPHAVRTLYEQLSGAEANVAMVAADLHDVHLGRPIQGIRMSRHAIAVRYPFEGVGEKRRLKQMRAGGYAVQEVPKWVMGTANPVLGLYGAHGTLRSL